jgi:4-amino-4-deoxy-L-arabinose transferase-like glycosyltransferase
MSDSSSQPVRFKPTIALSSPRFWIGFSLFSLIVLTVAAYFWIVAHPHPINWDEALYFNRVQGDVWTLKNLGKRKFIEVLWSQNRSRPPLYRLLALPVGLLFGTNPFILRLTSLLYLWLTLGFVFLTVRRIGGSNAGAAIAIALPLCPVILKPSMFFFTEYSLYLPIAATLYFLLRDWNREQQRTSTWIGLGIALGLGSLAKVTFATIAGPMMLAAVILSGLKLVRTPSLRHLFSASGLGIAILLPWWILNWKPAWEFAQYSAQFVRSSVGPAGHPYTLVKWLSVVVQTGFGIPVALLVLAITVTFIVQLWRKRIKLDRTQATALCVCASGFVPLWLLAAVGDNHNPRLIAPSFFPLMAAVGIFAALTHWTTTRWLSGTAAALLACQLLIIVTPSPGDPQYKSEAAGMAGAPWQTPKTARLLQLNPASVMRRSNLWDWTQLRSLCLERQLTQPKVAYLGNIDRINAPQINFPWIQAGQNITVTELWRSASGEAIDWSEIMAIVRDSDVAIVQPVDSGTYAEKEAGAADSQHNNELIARVRATGEFEEISLTMGRFEPVELLVFVK